MPTQDAFVTSKDIITKTGISRATLNNYIKLGILPRPVVRNPGTRGYGARQIGYFPEWVIDRVLSVQSLKKGGLAMEAITQRLVLDSLSKDVGINFKNKPSPVPDQVSSASEDSEISSSQRFVSGGSLYLTIDAIAHPAYMLNYQMEIIWFNEAARDKILGGFCQLPPQIEARNIFRFLLDDTNVSPLARNRSLIEFHLALAKERMGNEGLAGLAHELEPRDFKVVDAIYAETEAIHSRPVAECPLPAFDGCTSERACVAYATQYREGILFVFVPSDQPHDNLLHLLARRDEVIRSLLRRRLPVLTHLVALVADLQNSVRICAELPPEEYFELINQIWATLDPVFRKYYGAYGKHAGDGLVYYFFQQPDSNFILNALRCSVEIRESIRRISKEWQIRKGWFTELHMNIGLNEGQEWLGTFQTSTSVELTVLGDTINQAARLSDLARFGEIWTSKGLIAKLPPEARERVHYGVRRRTPDGRDHFVRSSYTTLTAWYDTHAEQISNEKLRDIAHLPIAEIVDVT